MKRNLQNLQRVMLLCTFTCCLVVVGYGITGCNNKESAPIVTRRVTDQTSTLSNKEADRLEEKLTEHERQTSNQIAIVIIDSLGGKSIEEVSMEICQKNKFGQEGKDNGILVLIAIEDREGRIEVGSGLEGAIPDVTCRRIWDYEIKPHFKQENFYEGLDHGTNMIMLAIKGEYTGENTAADQIGGITKKQIIIFVIIGVILLIIFIGSAAGGRGGFISGGGWSSSGGGGGVFSGGGGGFSGGGFSGGW
jgi:uncharacterized protein